MRFAHVLFAASIVILAFAGAGCVGPSGATDGLKSAQPGGVWGTVAQWASAFATTAAVIIALRPTIKDSLWPPRLSLEPHNGLRASYIPLPTGQDAFMWHLSIKNSRPDKLAEGCRVQLVGIRRLSAEGGWEALPLPIPLPFVWAPAEARILNREIGRTAVMDFGRITAGAPPELGINPDGLDVFFAPQLQFRTYGFAGFIEVGSVVRYQLDIDSNTHPADSAYEVEVRWDGVKTLDPREVDKHVVLTLHKCSLET